MEEFKAGAGFKIHNIISDHLTEFVFQSDTLLGIESVNRKVSMRLGSSLKEISFKLSRGDCKHLEEGALLP